MLNTSCVKRGVGVAHEVQGFTVERSLRVRWRNLTHPMIARNLLVLLGAGLLGCVSLSAQMTFDFANAHSNNDPIAGRKSANANADLASGSITGWYAYRGATATDHTFTDADTSTVNRIGLSNGAGANTSTDRGFLFSVSVAATPTDRWLAYTTFEAFTPTTVTWAAGNSTANALVRLAVQSGGSWYATEATFTTAALTLANFQNAAEAKSFDFGNNLAAANWRTITFTPGSELTLGSAGSVSSSFGADITALGFFVEHVAASTVRIDNLFIDGSPASAVPEPSTYALIFGAAAIGLAGWRRKRSRAANA